MVNTNKGLKYSWILSTKQCNLWNWLNHSSSANDNFFPSPWKVSSFVLSLSSFANNEEMEMRAQNRVKTAMTDDWTHIPVPNETIVKAGGISILALEAVVLQISAWPRLNIFPKLYAVIIDDTVGFKVTNSVNSFKRNRLYQMLQTNSNYNIRIIIYNTSKDIAISKRQRFLHLR